MRKRIVFFHIIYNTHKYAYGFYTNLYTSINITKANVKLPQNMPKHRILQFKNIWLKFLS